MFGALLLAVTAATGSPKTEVLKPVRVLRDERSDWASVTRAPALSAWLLARVGGEVYQLGDGSAEPRLLVRKDQAGGRPLLVSAFAAAANGERVLVADALNGHLVEADVVTGKPRRATFAPGFAGAGVAWNGTAWVVAGAFDGDIAVQFREPRELKVVSRYAPPALERRRLLRVSLQGSIASGRDGQVLVAFSGLDRAIVLDGRGSEILSLQLPIPADRLVSDGGRTTMPSSPAEVERMWAGRVIPAGAGWTRDDPSVLLQAADPPTSLVWCRFSSRDGHLKATYSLDVPFDPRSSYMAASGPGSGGTKLMVVRAWGAGSVRRSSFHEFLVPE